MKKTLIVFAFMMFAISSFSQTKILMEKRGGVYEVPCKVNGLSLKFIFDTGASDVSISLAEAIFMLKNGYLDIKDIGEEVYYSIANGDVAKGTKLNIREIEFAGLKLYNVGASIVHETSAPLLLGQSVISRLGKIQLNGNELIIMNGKSNEYNFSIDSNNNLVSEKITWNQLSKIKFDNKPHRDYPNGVMFPVVNSELKAISGRKITISGFIIPIDNNTYVLSSNVFASCFFCGQAGPETIMGIQFKSLKKRLKTDQYVTIEGFFSYNETDVEDWIYHITNAVIIKGG